MIIKNLTVEHKKGSGYTTISLFNQDGSIFKSIGFRQSQKDFDESEWNFDNNFIRTLNRDEYEYYFERMAIPKAKNIIQEQFNINISQYNGDCEYTDTSDFRHIKYIRCWKQIINNNNGVFLGEKYTTKFYLKEDITKSDIERIFEYFLKKEMI